jgi:hypothetical protein
MQNYKAPDNSVHCIEPQFEYMLPVGSVHITEDEANELRKPKELPVEEINAEADTLRSIAYREETDPLFFKYQRGEITKKVWLAAVEDIKNRYPKV